MLKINPLSLLRRALARGSELAFVGEVADGLGIANGFHEELFGRNLLGYALIAFAISAIFDLCEICTRPDLSAPTVVDDEPELPLRGLP